MVLSRVQFSGPNRTYQIALRVLCHWNSVGIFVLQGTLVVFHLLLLLFVIY